MYLAALVSLALAILSAALAIFWTRAKGSPAEHWLARRQRQSKARAHRTRAIVLGVAAIGFCGFEVVRAYIA